MKPLSPFFAAAVAFTLAGCAGSPGTPPVSGDVFAAMPVHRAAGAGPSAAPLCARAPLGAFACFAWARTDRSAIGGLSPRDLRSAYKLPSRALGRGQTVAIVDAYDDPRAESDVNVYRNRFALGTCTTANGCFEKVNESGRRGGYPHVDAGWAGEISLDLDMVSAICPNCRLLLVEATSNSARDLGFAVRTAARLGATVISNSYGGFEYAPYDPNFDQRGKAIVVAGTGDSGYFPEQPASFATVVAVGGTTLERAANDRGWNERVWNDPDVGATGSGCSDFVAKPPWQVDEGCPTRAEADVAAVADPLTGVAVYDSLALANRPSGWLTMGGTSVATPIVAATFALAGNAVAISWTPARTIYLAGGSQALNHIDEGTNGRCPRVYLYICKAGKGYNGPTGWGTPNGIGAF
jgi:subtilase family serine protease